MQCGGASNGALLVAGSSRRACRTRWHRSAIRQAIASGWPRKHTEGIMGVVAGQRGVGCCTGESLRREAPSPPQDWGRFVQHFATSASTPLNAPHYSGRNRSPRRAAPGTQRTGSPARTYWPADCTRDSRTPRAAPPLPSQAHGGPPQRARSPRPCDAWSPQ